MLKDYFNERADIWDHIAAEKDATKLIRLAKDLKLKKGDVVLDVGTGTGVFLPFILDQIGPPGNIYGLDIAEKMLAKARQKYPNKNIKFICGNVEEIPLQAETCNVVICYSSFPHFQNKPLALREIKRVLKTGGALFILHSSGREHINRIHHHNTLTQNDLLPNATEMSELLLNTGFKNIRVIDKVESYRASAKKV